MTVNLENEDVIADNLYELNKQSIGLMTHWIPRGPVLRPLMHKRSMQIAGQVLIGPGWSRQRFQRPGHELEFDGKLLT
jgi:hypothetical protein